MTLALTWVAAFALAAALLDLPALVPRHGPRRRRTRRAAAPDARLAAAGIDDRLVAGDVTAARWLAAAAALALAVPAAAAAPGRSGLVALVALPAGAALLPDRAIAVRARRRAAAMAEELPDVLGLLLAALRAGLPPRRAVAEAARHGRGPLAGELRAADRRAAAGEPWCTALNRFERRCPAPAVPALAEALRRAHRDGASPVAALAALAADARAARAVARRERAARAAPQIQLVVALLLVPAVLLLVTAVLLPSLG